MNTSASMPPWPGRRAALAIGMFDGVHLGHQQVIRQAVADARQHSASSLVITFDRHPNAVVAPERVPPLIYPLSKRLSLFSQLGADAAWVIPFHREFSEKPAELFIRELASACEICAVCVGSRFSFGYQRSGNVSLLQQLGSELGFYVHGLAAVSLDGKAVSSTRIREAIRAGHLDAATQMLGRTYALAGTVVQGRRLGRTLGFPTANLDVHGLATPPPGVYAAHAETPAGRFPAAVNIGFRPTVESASLNLAVEAHLLDFEGDLYGQTIELVLIEKLRGERTFPSAQALAEQIGQDVRQARRVLDLPSV